MLSYIEEELNKRTATFQHITVRLEELFVLDRTARLRRNVVHEALGIPQGNWTTKRLVNEKLSSMGVKKVITDGRRWFVGIAWKSKTK